MKAILQARTIGSDSQRRHWCLPKPYSFGQRKPSHLRQINCANWQHALGNWGRLCSHWPLSPMKTSWWITPSPLGEDNVFKNFQGRGEEVQEAARAWGRETMERAHPRGSFQTIPLLDVPGPSSSPWPQWNQLPPPPLPPAGGLFLIGYPHLQIILKRKR